MLASLGCGNPTALAELHDGEIVLDLGSGGGIDVLLSARRVGPDRQGVRPRHDRRDARARATRTSARPASTNVEFLKGEIERIPLPDDSVDVIISNCVINLSGDKRRCCARRSACSSPAAASRCRDVVVRGEAPAECAQSMELWVGCVAGALEEQEFLATARRGGLRAIRASSRRASTRSRMRAAFLAGSGLDVDACRREIDGSS